METRRKRGFTIIEMMLTVVVAMIVLDFGVPNFLNLIRSNATVTAVNNLATALNLARSEAVARGVEVIITPQAGNDWTSGWVVGVDSDEDDSFPEAGEPVFRRFEAIDSLAFTASPARVEFRPTGEVLAIASFAMVPHSCDDATNRQRVLNVAMAGYVDLQQQNCP